MHAKLETGKRGQKTELTGSLRRCRPAMDCSAIQEEEGTIYA